MASLSLQRSSHASAHLASSTTRSSGALPKALTPLVSSRHAAAGTASVSGLRCPAAAAPGLGAARTSTISHALTSTNPAFSYGRLDDAVRQRDSSGIMTLDGAVQKTSILLGVTVLGAAYTWMQVFSGNAAAAMAAIGAGKVAGIVALVSALATMFKPQWAPSTSLIFAAAKGVALGAFSSVMELRYPGIVLNATMLVLGTAASLLGAYSSGLITVTDKFRDGVMMVTGGYMFVILGSWLMSLVGVQLPGLFSAGPIGIGLSLVAAALAASNLLLDFDMIRSMARSRVPKWLEWYGAWSLLITLVWMWTEAIRLLSLLAGGGRDD